MSSDKKTRVNLKMVAEKVGLAPCSISAVLNDTPASRTIPQATKDRIFRAAAELNYRPNFWARSLRMQRTRMVAVVTPDFGRAAVARVIAAAQRSLHDNGYLLVLSTSNPAEAISPAFFQQKGMEGLIVIDASLPLDADMDIVSVDLTYLSSSDEGEDGLQGWLLELGQSAAKEIVQKIESRHGAKMVPQESKTSTSYLWGSAPAIEATGTNAA